MAQCQQDLMYLLRSSRSIRDFNSNFACLFVGKPIVRKRLVLSIPTFPQFNS